VDENLAALYDILEKQSPIREVPSVNASAARS
jgi:hypothetical protein